jgi:tetratricopeptide (TPR) repeat protein
MQTFSVKKFLPSLCFAALFGSCSHEQKNITSNQFVDSTINHFSVPEIVKQNDQEMEFWKNRINPSMPGFLNESRYAGCLNMRFRFWGDINDLQKADSILKKVNRDYNYKEASVDLALTAHCISEHQFMKADSFLQKAKQLGIKPYESNSISFDVDFELGKYTDAKAELNAIESPDDYGYFFRKSKMFHLDGMLDSSIKYMLRAAALSNNNKYLKGVALSNAADLYIHSGELQNAYDLYKQCIQMNGADFHSMTGIGWIALVHDNNDSLAERIFSFVQSKNKLPDALFKLEQMAEAKHDAAAQLKYAEAFKEKATDTLFGRMYNKYLLQLYTGILQNPEQAESITKDELNNRANPQTYAWYAWALFSNNKKEEAYKVFQEHVSGKPLEGLELYWMGKMMDGLDKKYNAIAFFKAAYKNKYDLDPSMAMFIEKRLAE